MLPLRLIIGGILLPFLYILNRNVDKFFIFDQNHLHDLAKRSIAEHGNDTRAIVNYIVTELHSLLPSHVNLDEEWMFNNAGGCMGGMYIIHASLTEYIIIFGTAVGTEGHSGRHPVDNYFHILTGTQLAYNPGEFEPEVYPPGSQHYLPRGKVQQYKMPEACFALEYSRGWIPPMLFFGFADFFTSTLDFPSLWVNVRVTAREMIGNLIRFKFYSDASVWLWSDHDQQAFSLTAALVGSMACGVMRRAFEVALKFAKEDNRGGSVPIIQRQSVADLLINCKIKIDTSRLLVRNALDSFDKGTGNAASRLESCLQIKIYFGDAAVQAIWETMQAVGMKSYQTRSGLPALLNDAAVFSLFDGGNVGVRRRQYEKLLQSPDYDPWKNSY